MTAEEKLIAEIEEAFDGTYSSIARHVLRRERAAVRRARGRTIGWTTYSTDVAEEWCCRQDCEEAVRRSEGGCALARVVAVPRKGGRK